MNKIFKTLINLYVHSALLYTDTGRIQTFKNNLMLLLKRLQNYCNSLSTIALSLHAVQLRPSNCSATNCTENMHI